MQPIEKLRELYQKKRLNVEKLSKETAIPTARIYSWFNKNANPKAGDSNTLELWLEKNHKGTVVPKVQNVGEGQTDEIKNLVSEANHTYGGTSKDAKNNDLESLIPMILETNKMLANSIEAQSLANKINAEANLKDAETRNTLGENNKKLMDQIATVGAYSKNFEAVAANYRDLLEFVLAVSTGKNFHSKEEAIAYFLGGEDRRNLKAKSAEKSR